MPDVFNKGSTSGNENVAIFAKRILELILKMAIQRHPCKPGLLQKVYGVRGETLRVQSSIVGESFG